MEIFNVASISAIKDIPGLYISDITIPRSTELLQDHGITHVISVTNQRDRPNLEEGLGIQQLHIDIEDNPFEDLLMVLEGVCAWIEDALSSEVDFNTSQSDDTDTSVRKTVENTADSLNPDAVWPRKPKVLVHCLQGISRSGAIVIAYLMQTRSFDYESALESARASRSVIMPNSGFADQLRLWQQMGYSISVADQEENGTKERETKPGYQEWRSNRGVLLSRGEEEKQNVMRKNMADMAASFGKRRLELKRKNGT